MRYHQRTLPLSPGFRAAENLFEASVLDVALANDEIDVARGDELPPAVTSFEPEPAAGEASFLPGDEEGHRHRQAGAGFAPFRRLLGDPGIARVAVEPQGGPGRLLGQGPADPREEGGVGRTRVPGAGRDAIPRR